ncbi:MAG: metal ABC transporter permease [Anaerolineae bacterium]|nr:metal ABC transporter permease [Anaerolineae bacterium]
MNWIIEPLNYAFMQRSLTAALIVGAVCSIIGCYVVLKSMAFMGDAMAHAILPGVAVAYLLQANLMIGALVTAVIVALGIGYFSKEGTIKEDTVIGIVFSFALALGVVLISSIRSYAVDLSHILFGNLLGVSVQDLWITGILAGVVIITILALYKPFLVLSFDPILAATLRLPTTLLRYTLLVLLSLTIVVSIQSVGVGLVAAMLVTPAATAYLLARRLPVMMALSVLFGSLASLVGLYVSYYANVASGAGIVLTATLIFLIVFLVSPRRSKAAYWRK